MTFRVGQKVVCVRALLTENVIKDRIYTISAVNTELGKRFVGLVENKHYSGDPAPWFADRFRPLVERKTDISIFTSMLTPSPEKVLDAVMFDTLADIYLSHKQWTS